MAKKNRLIYKCRSCGHEEAKWLGRCPQCGSWNSFEEHEAAVHAPQGKKSSQKDSKDPVFLNQVSIEDKNRFSSGDSELDRVLGGGIMKGSAVLLGGEPGIGKSTLMLQMLASSEVKNVLYVTGEESLPQIRMRSQRLQIPIDHIRIIHETHIERIMQQIRRLKPELVVVDSVQTMMSEELGLVPATVSQVKFSSMELTDWAKYSDAAVFLIGHVTKEGSIAGPKVVEHLVDTVINFEQAETGVRIIRASKNRFGSVDEIGVFTMERTGLQPVGNPASFFLQKKGGTVFPGMIAAAVYEGTRTFMVEIQALTIPAKSGYTRVYSEKIDASRVSRIAAVIEKHLNIRLSEYDIYINVAGGIRLSEVAIELPLALAIYSAVTGKVLHAGLASVGEMSLAGEIRFVRNLESRIKTAADMGFHTIICPQSKDLKNQPGVSVNQCGSLSEAVRAALQQ
jgi:DNA repair protein RadA/Sms